MNLIKAREMAVELMQSHGVIAKGYGFEFDRASRRLGCCNYRLRKITLSKSYAEMNEEEQVRNTILHEIAHVLAGPGAGHGHKWKLTALSIGCDGNRVCTKNINRPKMKYVGTCPNCGRETQYRKMVGVACGVCCKKYNRGKFTDLYKLIFKENI